MTHQPATGFFKWLPAVVFVGYFVIALYIVAPLKSKRRQTKPLKDRYVPIDLLELPGDVSATFFKYAEWFAELGFQSLGTVDHPVLTTRQKSYITVWRNPTTMESAQIIGVLTPSPVGGFKIHTAVTFRTEFTDGTSIVTSNSKTAGIFPKDPLVSMARVPAASDVGMIFRFHRARVARDLAGRTPTLDRVTAAVTRMEYEHEKTFTRLVERGYYYVNEKLQSFVPTYRGAFVMTWKLLPPFKQIQLSRRKRHTEELLADLGFGSFAAFMAMKSKRTAPAATIAAQPIEPPSAAS